MENLSSLKIREVIRSLYEICERNIRKDYENRWLDVIKRFKQGSLLSPILLKVYLNTLMKKVLRERGILTEILWHMLIN